ncbi:MAG: hypothetical protein KDE20_19670, partial [Caldilineaceae bacterium]|nr:hypothetical protein [Caldilineaceae bacterium]
TNYALVWADVVTSISVTNLKPHTSGAANIGNGKTITIPANQLLEIPNIIAGQSTITMTDV